jgi:hypothetical protein
LIDTATNTPHGGSVGRDNRPFIWVLHAQS